MNKFGDVAWVVVALGALVCLIGTLASIALYEDLLAGSFEHQDIESAIKKWPNREELEGRIASLFEPDELRDVATKEMRAKYPSARALRDQLGRLVQAWPASSGAWAASAGGASSK